MPVYAGMTQKARKTLKSRSPPNSEDYTTQNLRLSTYCTHLTEKPKVFGFIM